MITPPIEDGQLTVLVPVPPNERANLAHDIADAYAVESNDSIPGGCIIWGLYHGQWQPNVSGRWLISKFINGATWMIVHEQCGGDGWWKGCNAILDIVRGCLGHGSAAASASQVAEAAEKYSSVFGIYAVPSFREGSYYWFAIIGKPQTRRCYLGLHLLINSG